MLRRKKKKKISGGLIVRLVDVVLILLFGFISISEVDKRTKIKLAESFAVPLTAPSRERVVYIGVLPDGRYLVEDETRTISDLRTMQNYIISKRDQLNRQKIKMRIRLRVNYNAPVQPAFKVVKICQLLKIPVGLDVIKKGGR